MNQEKSNKNFAEHTINSIKGLDGLLHKSYTPSEIKLRFQSISEKENEKWGQKINKSYHECGCKAGARAVGIGVLVTAAYILYNFGGETNINWSIVLYAVLATAFLSGISKEISKKHAKRQLKRSIGIVKSKVAKSPEPYQCG